MVNFEIIVQGSGSLLLLLHLPHQFFVCQIILVNLEDSLPILVELSAFFLKAAKELSAFVAMASRISLCLVIAAALFLALPFASEFSIFSIQSCEMFFRQKVEIFELVLCNF